MVLAWPAAAPQLPVEEPPHAATIHSQACEACHASQASSSSISSAGSHPAAAAFARPLAAKARHGCIDAVIQPQHTRAHLMAELGLLQGKHEPRAARKHSNMPIG